MGIDVQEHDLGFSESGREINVEFLDETPQRLRRALGLGRRRRRGGCDLRRFFAPGGFPANRCRGG
jgi:hypothetical protein